MSGKHGRSRIDLDRFQHWFRRLFALDIEVDAGAVRRALLWLLAEDAVLAERFRCMAPAPSCDYGRLVFLLRWRLLPLQARMKAR